ncbi:MAG: hypothetical protein ACI4S4_00575 [Candidatus Ornithospirochaeta sp.]
MTDEELLSRYRAMHKEVRENLRREEEKIEALSREGKAKTISFREALGKKGFWSQVMTMYRSFGIDDESDR